MSKISASVLAFEKKLVPSDGLMYGTTWEGRNSKTTPLILQEKSVRGTISNRLKKAIDPIKLNAEIEKANLQRVDSCALSPEQNTLRLNFTLKILSGVENPSACNSPEFNQTYAEAVKSYIKDYGFTELANRYVVNLVSGRFLWRNRVGCEDLEVQIKVLNKNDDFNETFDCFNYDNFNKGDAKTKKLTDKIAKTLSGENKFLLLEINAFAKVGKSQDVYPSEELVLDKSSTDKKSKKSKILFSVGDVAAMHSQKIGNAIRVVDTWYPKFAETNNPIAADPYGAVTNLGIAYRPEKHNFFNLFDKFSTGKEITENDKHFVMAVLVRGGVFGQKQS
ncbi:CRISPR-associated protein, Csy3 family [uncultured Gammaproteobacteria bacterium]|jgi:CRISPR-associated protein Csy3|nr:CRISPR-associated protein, Csy3 family [uncultured Gammaproteobacteria bacterium]CAC9558080.1 CRISPR-associated protein, Csy3 family [uncultured Gammaproteobacteria bacterium]CAC9570170.1 CRISPR-associated protein, Csy3 family [uncultured Gammaproteobacteria bacterium]CAC9978986.1 CRISPR-associated protein, Csy3 family [uncultured Gammaproteobacteria bacterium]